MANHIHSPGPDGAQPHLQPRPYDDCACLRKYPDLDGVAKDMYGAPDPFIAQAQQYLSGVNSQNARARSGKQPEQQPSDLLAFVGRPRQELQQPSLDGKVREFLTTFLRFEVGLSQQACQAYLMYHAYGATHAQIRKALNVTQPTESELLTIGRTKVRDWRAGHPDVKPDDLLERLVQRVLRLGFTDLLRQMSEVEQAVKAEQETGFYR